MSQVFYIKNYSSQNFFRQAAEKTERTSLNEIMMNKIIQAKTTKKGVSYHIT